MNGIVKSEDGGIPKDGGGNKGKGRGKERGGGGGGDAVVRYGTNDRVAAGEAGGADESHDGGVDGQWRWKGRCRVEVMIEMLVLCPIAPLKGFP